MSPVYYLRRFFGLFREVADTMVLLPQPYKKNKVKHYLDAFLCIARYGAMPEDYISLQFFKLPASERKKYVTQRNKHFR